MQVLSYDKKQFFYLEDKRWDGSNVRDYCYKNILCYLIPDYAASEEDFDVIITTRISTDVSDKIKPESCIYLYDDDIKKCDRKWIAILCSEKRMLHDSIVWRIYFLGFVTLPILKTHCNQTNLIFPSRNTMKIQGVIPKKSFYLFQLQHVSIQTISSSSDLPNKKQKLESSTLIEAKRLGPTIYLYILHWDRLSTQDLYSMMDMETQCIQRIELLWFRKKEVIQSRNRQTESWSQDRRVIQSLLLVMGWQEEWKQWYIQAERWYIQTICHAMFDIQDYILNIRYNDLSENLPVTEENQHDKEMFCKQLMDIQEKRMNIIMNHWMKENHQDSNKMSLNLVNLMKRIHEMLKTHKINTM